MNTPRSNLLVIDPQWADMDDIERAIIGDDAVMHVRKSVDGALADMADYGTTEVADHAVALAFSLLRGV